MLKEHDVVAATQDMPDEGLGVGDVGAVVHCYPDADAFEVEFVDEHGHTKCVTTIAGSRLMKLNLLSLSA